MTNVWQAVVGGGVIALARRLWPMLVGICVGTFVGAVLLPHDDTGPATIWLGLALGFIRRSGWSMGISVPRRAEIWLGLLIGTATGAITVATGIFVMPGTPYIQSLKFERDKLVQALGLSFSVSTITLALALAYAGQIRASLAGASLLLFLRRLLGWSSGKWCAGKFGRKPSGCGSLSDCCCSVPIWRYAGFVDGLAQSTAARRII